MNLFRRIIADTCSNWKCMRAHVQKLKYNYLSNSIHCKVQNTCPSNEKATPLVQQIIWFHTLSKFKRRWLIPVHTHELVPTYHCWHIFELEMHARTRFSKTKIQLLVELHPLQSSKHMPEQRKSNTTRAANCLISHTLKSQKAMTCTSSHTWPCSDVAMSTHVLIGIWKVNDVLHDVPVHTHELVPMYQFRHHF